MKKTPAKKATVQKAEDVLEMKPSFTITVKIEHSIYEGKGETALEALRAVPVPPLDLISTGTVTVTHGDSVRELLYPTMQLKRLLNPYHMDVLINDLIAGM